jgi:hypothetical protein
MSKLESRNLRLASTVAAVLVLVLAGPIFGPTVWFRCLLLIC